MSRYERNKHSYSYDEDVIHEVDDVTILTILNYKEQCATIRVRYYQYGQHPSDYVIKHKTLLFDCESLLYDIKESFYTKWKSRYLIERYEIKKDIMLLNEIIDYLREYLNGLE